MNAQAGNKISRRLLVQWRMELILSGQKQLTEIILWTESQTGVSVSYKCYRHDHHHTFCFTYCYLIL